MIRLQVLRLEVPLIAKDETKQEGPAILPGLLVFKTVGRFV